MRDMIIYKTEKEANEILDNLKGNTCLIDYDSDAYVRFDLEDWEEKISFGKREGLAIYLDWVNFSENIYKECDSNYVISEIFRLTGCNDDIIRFCEGGTEIAIYLYDKSFDDMKRNILKCGWGAIE